MATYGDGLGNIDLKALIKTHEDSGGLATLTTVPLRSQYGVVATDANNKVSHFEEKPVIEDYWINAGFFVFEKEALTQWQGSNLEQEVLPRFAGKEQLFTFKHHGFWKSMDTSKDQQELESLIHQDTPPWVVV